MDKLSRFKKPGGFQQLLVLIESCEPQKQTSLLHMVASEDPGWAHLLKVKALTLPRILDWPVEVLMEVTPHLQDHSIAMIYRMAQDISRKAKKNTHDRFLKAIPHTKNNEILEIANSIRFTESDQTATVIRLLQIIRELESKGKLNFQSFDPTLVIDIKIAS